MLLDKFVGYNKPVLRLEKGELAAGNTPVPKGLWQPRLVSISGRLDQVRSVAVVKSLIGKFRPQSGAGSGERSSAVAQTRQVILRMLESFRDLDRARNRVFVLVYFPGNAECYRKEAEEDWRQWMEAEASERGITMIDLLPDFLGLPVRKISEMFIQEGSPGYFAETGHYSVAGNTFVAERLYSHLLSIPEIHEKLATLPPR
jgi:hypothetical protein